MKRIVSENTRQEAFRFICQEVVYKINGVLAKASKQRGWKMYLQIGIYVLSEDWEAVERKPLWTKDMRNEDKSRMLWDNDQACG